ncbi:MaoC family dehydratase N-terminal domain-containing protein [Dehalococcoidia bacterium]|nr:MaoC family dehydratase N-terminal domain-containing protein [Dehalococcoidia bacterium]
MASVDRNVTAVITTEMLQRARKRLGEEIPITAPFNTEARRDGIRHWADGIGDVNPLWVDEDYGQKSQYGSMLAPPSFLYSCNQGPAHRGAGAGGFRGFPGVHRFWAKEWWEWFRPIRLGDQIRGVTKLVDLVEHKSSLAKRSIEDITEQTFRNRTGDIIAIHRMHYLNTERDTAAKVGKHREFQKHKYSEDDLNRILADIDNEVIRGSKPRYFEDTEIGEDIPAVVKGPYTSTETVAFLVGWGGPFTMASELTHKYIRAHPKANVPDRETNAPDFPERAHWDDAFAQEVGAPAAYDFGAQRVAWVIHALTNWSGDDALIRSIDAKLVKFNVMGDATWCKGRVTGKAIVQDEPIIELDIWGENQRGEITITGNARVRLPRRP